MDTKKKRTTLGKFIRKLSIIFLVCSILSWSDSLVEADEPNNSGLDMGALANIASSLSSNPQIMSLVSSFLNPKQSASPSSQNSDFGMTDTDPNTGAQDSSLLLPNQPQIVNNQPVQEPLRRAGRQQTEPKPEAAAAASAKPNPLSNLLSLASNVLPGINVNNLVNTLGSSRSANLNKPEQATTLTNSTSTNAVNQVYQQQPAATNSAQGVINQILTAYGNGQIPPELIQLALSGRVPPQIVDLALSGQVPPQLIQMIITGQIPMSTINAFLNSVQSQPVAESAQASPAKLGGQIRSPDSPQPKSGPFATSRQLFETLFTPKTQGQSVTIPTLFGPVLIQRPSVRRLGQMFGEGISTVASMIPF